MFGKEFDILYLELKKKIKASHHGGKSRLLLDFFILIYGLLFLIEFLFGGIL